MNENVNEDSYKHHVEFHKKVINMSNKTRYFSLLKLVTFWILGGIRKAKHLLQFYDQQAEYHCVRQYPKITQLQSARADRRETVYR